MPKKQDNQPAVDLKATFADLKLSQDTLTRLDRIGFEHPTPIQEKTIPLLLKGKDVIGQARTGTGKTAAFGLPIIETYDPSLPHVQALILAPTRELAIQIEEELLNLAGERDFTTVCLYGGASIEPQQKALKKGVHVVVGTPGRIMDHMERGNLDLTDTKLIVLDEADRMLDMGFIEDVEWILRRMPGKHHRQTLLFSATMPDEIKNLTNRFMVKPAFIRVSADELTVPDIEQVYYPVGRKNKLWALTRVLDNDKDVDLAIIFCATKRMCDRLRDDLKNMGFAAEALHGDLPQVKREKVLERFDKGDVKVLIATDVAARGLDINRITHVINYDLPDQEPEVYVHRIGRTGRAGRKGKSISFVGLDDKPVLKRIEMLIGREIAEGEPPSGKERIRRRIDWDELADKFGFVHIKVDAGKDVGLTPFKVHRIVSDATRLDDHAIRDIQVADSETTFAVPKDRAAGAKDAFKRASKGRIKGSFIERQTTVREA